jgi:hypothetical protein
MAQTLKTILSIDMTRFKAGLNNAKGAVAGFDKSLIAPLGNIIRRLTQMATVAGLAAGAFVAFGMKAAAGIQSAQMRLAGVSAGVKDFQDSWKAAYEVFIRSPLELDESVKSMIMLKNAGVGSKKALEAVGGAATALGRPVEELARAVLSMESETLKRLGLRARSVAKGMETAFTIEGLDKSGRKISRFANNIHDARKALLEMLKIKYGGVLDAMSRSFEGVMSTFRGVRQMAFFEIFKSSLTTLSPLIMAFNDKIIAMSESGALARFGEKIGNFVIRAISAMTRLYQFIKNFSFREWVMNNLGYVVSFGTVFAMVFGVKAVSAIMNLIAAIQLLPRAMQGALGIAGALAAGWNIGKILESKFDISYYVAKFLRGIALVGNIIGEMATGFDPAAIEQHRANYEAEIAILKKDHDALMNKEGAATADWIKDAFAKYKMISAEELAGMVGGGGEAGGNDMPKEAGKWRNQIDDSERRGIGKIFGGGALGGGSEEKRTKAALAMVKKQGTTNELLQQVVTGLTDNTRMGALAF